MGTQERTEVPVHLRVTQRDRVETWARTFVARGTDEEGGVRLSVRLALPLVGLLVHYGGRVRIVEVGAEPSAIGAAAAGPPSP